MIAASIAIVLDIIICFGTMIPIISGDRVGVGVLVSIVPASAAGVVIALPNTSGADGGTDVGVSGIFVGTGVSVGDCVGTGVTVGVGVRVGTGQLFAALGVAGVLQITQLFAPSGILPIDV